MRQHFPECVTYSNRYNFRCNICGDSGKNKNKKRGNIVKARKSGQYYFTCYNCGSIYPKIEKWIKEYFPEQYEQYNRELFRETNSNKPKQEPIINVPKVDTKPKPKQEIHFRPILSDSPLKDVATKFCTDRKIPEKYWSKFYISLDGIYKNRLIIPFYNKENKIYYYQARVLPNIDYGKYGEDKYTCKMGKKFAFNIHNIDNEKPVCIVEGPIDSMFIENSVACIGLKDLQRQELTNINKRYWLLDDDKAGKEAMKSLLEKGEYVFNWEMYRKKNKIFKSGKLDINDLYLLMNREQVFTFKDFEKFFTNSIYDKIYF